MASLAGSTGADATPVTDVAVRDLRSGCRGPGLGVAQQADRRGGLEDDAHPDQADAGDRLGGRRGAPPPAGSPGGQLRPAGGRCGPPAGPRRRGRPRRTRPGPSGRATPVSAETTARAIAEIGAGLDQAHPTDGQGVDVAPWRRARRTRLLQHRQQQGQAAAVDALGRPAGDGTGDSAHEGLHLDQDRPVALRGGHHDRAGHARCDDRPGTGRWGRAPRPGRLSVISNRPSSSVAPNRCLTARSSRRAWCRSPSKARTVSTTCSSTRGPARWPSLVTWPTSTTAHAPAPWPRCTRRWAHSRTWVTEPGRRGGLRVEHGLHRVDHEEVGRDLVEGAEHVRHRGLGGHQQPVGQRPESLGPEPDLLRATPRR